MKLDFAHVFADGAPKARDVLDKVLAADVGGTGKEWLAGTEAALGPRRPIDRASVAAEVFGSAKAGFGVTVCGAFRDRDPAARNPGSFVLGWLGAPKVPASPKPPVNRAGSTVAADRPPETGADPHEPSPPPCRPSRPRPPSGARR